MHATKLVGPEAASQKYDLLTALGSFALAGPAGTQKLVLRFLTLITARYNWRVGALRVGQREIAQLWSVDERTVKREMAKLRALGWIVLESPARRGRVASYALDLPAIRAATRDGWANVGGDFVARMSEVAGSMLPSTVVAFPRPEAARPVAPETVDDGSGTGGVWEAFRENLRAEDPSIFANWFAEMTRGDGAGDTLVLVAPSTFHASYIRTHFAERLLRAARDTAGRPNLSIVTARGEGPWRLIG